MKTKRRPSLAVASLEKWPRSFSASKVRHGEYRGLFSTALQVQQQGLCDAFTVRLKLRDGTVVE